MIKKLLLTAVFFPLFLIAKAQEPLKLAEKLFQRQQYQEASVFYRQALARDPGNWKAWRSLGLCLLNLNEKHKQAEQAFLKAVQLNPNDMISCYHLGILYRQAALEAEESDEKARLSAHSFQYLVKAAELGSTDAKFALSNK